MKAPPSVIAALILLTSCSALACTPEETEAKARELAARVALLTESNPIKAEEIREEMRAMGLRTSAKDLPSDCAVYERRLLELESAAREAEEATGAGGY